MDDVEASHARKAQDLDQQRRKLEADLARKSWSTIVSHVTSFLYSACTAVLQQDYLPHVVQMQRWVLNRYAVASLCTLYSQF